MSSTLDGVVYKIDHSNSTLNLYTNFSQNDRITLNSTPCDRNYTGSCKGLVSSFTPMQFQAFDIGRETTQNEAQLGDCLNVCMLQCTDTMNIDDLVTKTNTLQYQQCNGYCHEKCDRETRKDFI